MKTYNIRINDNKDRTISNLVNIPAYLYEYENYTFLIHKTYLSIKNNNKNNPAWQVSEFSTGMGFSHIQDSKKDCYTFIHNWFNVDNKQSKIDFLNQAIQSAIKDYGIANE